MQRPGVAPQLRRPLPIDMPQLPNKIQMGNPIGLSPHFPPQGIQVQPHNILGQAYIELCHRAPEGRPRLPFNASSTIVMNPVSQHQPHAGFVPRQNCQGIRHVERCNPPGLNDPLHVSSDLDHLPPSQQDTLNPNHPSVLVMGPSGNEAFSGTPLPTSTQISNQSTDGLEEKLDPEDPSVKDLDAKDLEGVEVKDLVDDDLENLNLDPEDGKGDELDTLDNLETNDGHLDYLLRSGEFDIIAYTDPGHDLGDKKSIFSAELDLNVPIDDRLDIQGKADDVQPKHQNEAGSLALQNKPADMSEIKTEVMSPNVLEEAEPENEKSDANVASSGNRLASEAELHNTGEKSALPCRMEVSENASTNEEATASNLAAAQGPAQSTASSCNISGATPVLTSLLTHEGSENPDVGPLSSPPHSLPAAQKSPVSNIPQTLMTPVGHTTETALISKVNLAPQISHSFSQGAAVNPGFISGQPANHSFGPGQPGNQTVPVVNHPGPSGMPAPQPMMLPQTLAQQQNRERPLLLEEQPLLLQDLLDQERQEQQQQRQMQAMIRQRSEPFFPNIGM